MWKIKGYQGKRSEYRQAHCVKLKVPEDRFYRQQFYDNTYERGEWCEKNCTGEWSTGSHWSSATYWFEKANDALLFKLTWGGL